MAEVSLAASLLALAVALVALRVAVQAGAGGGRSGPRPNELSASLGVPLAASPEAAPLATGAGPSLAVLDLLSRGKKIEAIKQYRTETGASLAESKRAVDALDRGRR